MNKLATTQISNHMRQRARTLRRDMTYTEIMLWQELKNSQLSGLKFRRQQPIDRYVADFYCAEKKLIIEIDGSSHNFASIYDNDLEKQSVLQKLGYTILRFDDAEIHNTIDNVLIAIQKQADMIKP